MLPIPISRSLDVLSSTVPAARAWVTAPHALLPISGEGRPKNSESIFMFFLKKTIQRRAIEGAARRGAVKVRPSLESLESRVALYSASGNAWPHPADITISFMPDGTDLGGLGSNL